jgi:hypothetical protein
MKKMFYFFMLSLCTTFLPAQELKYEQSEAFGNAGGWIKLLQLTNGNTFLFQLMEISRK